MPTKRRGSRARSRPAEMAKVEPAADVVEQRANLIEAVRNWLAELWQGMVEFGQRVWMAVKDMATFTKDLAQLVWCWVFDPQEFLAAKTRFRLKYLNTQIDANELALALTAALAR